MKNFKVVTRDTRSGQHVIDSQAFTFTQAVEAKRDSLAIKGLPAHLEMKIEKIDHSPKLTVLSFGGGQDSTALLYKYIYDLDFRNAYAPGDFIVVMSDTGDEHPHTLTHVTEIKSVCKKWGIPFFHLTQDMGLHGSWGTLRGFWRRTKTVGSKAFPKTCTDNLKLQPIYRFLEKWLGDTYEVETGRKKGFKEFAALHGKISMMIGIAKGEESRVADPEKDTKKWRKQSIQNVYPLIDLGLDRAGCQEYIKSVGYKVPMPSNCILCPFMSEQELLWLYRFLPADFNDWVNIEQNKLQANTHKENNLGVWGKKTLAEKLIDAQEKYGHMTDEELNEYKMSHGHCVKSKY